MTRLPIARMIIGYLILFFVVFVVVLATIQVVTHKDERTNNDLLLKEYQEAYLILLNTDKECADKFGKIIDSLNTN